MLSRFRYRLAHLFVIIARILLFVYTYIEIFDIPHNITSHGHVSCSVRCLSTLLTRLSNSRAKQPVILTIGQLTQLFLCKYSITWKLFLPIVRMLARIYRNINNYWNCSCDYSIIWLHNNMNTVCLRSLWVKEDMWCMTN
jgi:hypothetical protein